MHREARRDLYYHGTSFENLRSILKRGLVPNGGASSYTSIIPNESFAYKTFGGVYLTRQMSIAVDYAASAVTSSGNQGKIVIVAVTLESRSPTVTLDEDMMTSVLEDIGLEKVKDLVPLFPDLRAINRSTSQEDLEEILWTVSEKIETSNWTAQAKKYLNRLEKDVPFLKSIRENPNLLEVAKIALQATALHLLEGWVYLYGHTEPIDFLEGSYYRYKAGWEDVLKLFRKAVDSAKGKLSKNVRIQRPIGYRGRNRIVSVVEEQTLGTRHSGMKGFPVALRVWYGVFPQVMKQAMLQTAQPSYYEIQNRAGKVVELG